MVALSDPLFNELQIGIKNADESSVRETYLQALRGCLEPAGNKMSPPVRRQLLQHLLAYESHPEDVTRFTYLHTYFHIFEYIFLNPLNESYLSVNLKWFSGAQHAVVWDLSSNGCRMTKWRC